MKMQHLFALALLTAVCPMAAQAALSLPDVPAAQAQAKAADKPALILWYGADWQPDAAAIEAQWNKLAEAGLPVVLGVYNDAIGTAWDARQRALPVSTYNAPMGVLLAADGSLLATYPGRVVRDAEATAAAVNKTLAVVPEFTRLLAQARTLTGSAAAEAAGKALSLLAPADAVQHAELKKIITTQDPQDTTGYKAEFCTDHLAMYADINRILRGGADGNLSGSARCFTEAEGYIKAVLAKRPMFTEQHQQWLCGLAYVYRERFTSCKDEAARTDMLRCYAEAAALDPTTQVGKGAAKYRQYWDPTSYYVVRDHFYDAYCQTHNFDKEWRIDVTEDVKAGAGTYSFRLVPYADGAMVTRDYRLFVNGKQVSDNGDAQLNTKSVELSLPEIPADAVVEVRLIARCLDHWMGPSGKVVMEKTKP